MWNPQLAGGALLDMGVYPISFTSMVMGAPERVTATGITGPDGVDLRATALLQFGAKTDAVITTSLISPLPVRASVFGSAGRADPLPLLRAQRHHVLSRRGQQGRRGVDRYDVRGSS